VGNKAFSESTLKGLFDQDTGGWLSWYTKSDRYARTKLNADLETLRSYYLQRGYLEFRVDSTQVAISPDKQDISISVNVTEGERFVVSGVKLEGNFLDREDEFKSLVAIRPGEPYNADQVTETTKAFSEYFGRILVLRLRVSRRCRRLTAKTVVCRWCFRPNRPAGLMCGASMWRQQPHA
jgi:outer membrane protein insertion porin family